MVKYLDKTTNELKTFTEIEKEYQHMNIVEWSFIDYAPIEDYIEEYFIVLDEEKDEEMLMLHLDTIKDFQELKQELSQSQLSFVVFSNLREKLEKKISRHKEKTEEIIKKYPKGFFDYVDYIKKVKNMNMKKIECKKCGSRFYPAHNDDYYCEECQAEYEEEQREFGWEQRHGFSNYDLDELIEEEEEEDE